MKATIDTITITLGEKTVTLTMEEAEAIQALLNERLGAKGVQILPVIIERPAPAPYRDTWILPDSPSYSFEPYCGIPQRGR